MGRSPDIPAIQLAQPSLTEGCPVHDSGIVQLGRDKSARFAKFSRFWLIGSVLGAGFARFLSLNLQRSGVPCWVESRLEFSSGVPILMLPVKSLSAVGERVGLTHSVLLAFFACIFWIAN